MDQIISDMTSTATIAIAVFGIMFCAMQTRYSRVSRSFAVFLLAIALNNVADAFGRFFDLLPLAYVQVAELVIWSPSSLCLAPLFWIYVHTLTSPTQQVPARLYRHFLLPGLSVLVGLMIALQGEDVKTVIFSDQQPPVLSIWSVIVLGAFVLLQLAVFPQIGVYLFLIVRRLMRYRIMLRDVYASTEEHELRWIYVIGALCAVFWVASVINQVLILDPEDADAVSLVFGFACLVGLVMVATLTLWGLRQRPPLVPDTNHQPPPVVEPSPEQGEKYEKSALSSDASTRIARKLRAAMEQDYLHRDPNLSLWALARHIGASPNYISQTLSEAIGENFFDFVNGYRIAEAKEMLATTNETVLMITYEVGFNARSSFYNAFKRVMGETPTSYRKKMSQPTGVDDRDTGLSDT